MSAKKAVKKAAKKKAVKKVVKKAAKKKVVKKAVKKVAKKKVVKKKVVKKAVKKVAKKKVVKKAAKKKVVKKVAKKVVKKVVKKAKKPAVKKAPAKVEKPLWAAVSVEQGYVIKEEAPAVAPSTPGPTHMLRLPVFLRAERSGLPEFMAINLELRAAQLNTLLEKILWTGCQYG